MKKMSDSENVIKALFDNQEFLTKFQSLVEEQVSKCNLTDGILEKNGTEAKNKKRTLLRNDSKSSYKKRRISNKSSSKQTDSIEDIKSLLRNEDIKKKISECIVLTNSSGNSSDTTEDVRSAEEEIKFLNNSDAVMKSPSPSFNKIETKEKETSDLIKKDNTIILVPIKTTNNKIISTDNITNHGDNSKISVPGDYYYLSMVNSSNTTVSEVSEKPQIRNITCNILNDANINDAIVTTEPNISTLEDKQNVLKPVIKSNENVRLQSKIIKRNIIFPHFNVTDQVNAINFKNNGSATTQNTSNYQTIFVLTDNGEKPLKILQPNTQKITKINKLLSGSKPVIKSNERVKLQGKIITKFQNNINGIVMSNVGDNNIIHADPADTLKLPKIESVMSYAECLPKITNVTSYATNVSNIENIVMHAPNLECTEAVISLSERISPNLIDSHEKVLKIERHTTKDENKKNSRNKISHQVKNRNSKIGSNSVNFTKNTSVDATIEQVIAEVVGTLQDSNSVALNEKKSKEDTIGEGFVQSIHINELTVKNSPRKGLKVLRPLRRIKCANNSLQCDISNINSVTVELDNRSGLPSIENVISLAENHKLDNCLKNANQKLLNDNGMHTTNTIEEKYTFLKSDHRDDNGFKMPSELFENMDNDMQSENDDFNFAVESLIKDMSERKSNEKLPIRNNVSSLVPTRLFNASNIKNKKLKVLKPVIRKQKKGKRKGKFEKKKLPIVEDSNQNVKDDVDLMGRDFTNNNLDTQLSISDSKYIDSSLDTNTAIKTDNLQNKQSPLKPLETYQKNTVEDIVKEEVELQDIYVTESQINSKTVLENTSVIEDYEELLEEMPLQQRRCNNFYVKVPTGEELGNNIDLAEYEKFFSIQDENHPTKKIRKTEIESLDDNEDIQVTPGKRRSKCSKCDKTFVQPTMRKIHEATCEDSDPQSSECSKCGRWFARIAYRKIHEKKCQIVCSTIEVPVTPLNDLLRCAMCPFTTGHKTAYINHLKSHIYSHKKSTTLSTKSSALRKKFGSRRKKRKLHVEASKNYCEVCNDDSSGVEHMVSRCRRCGAFNLQWCNECQKGGYSTSCRLRHHDTECTAAPCTGCNDVPRVHVERIGPPLPLYCAECDVTRILYVEEKHCKQCSSELRFKCEMCDELRDTYAELCGHVARAHIIGGLVQCNDCGKNCEDLTLHQRNCGNQTKEKENATIDRESIHFSENENSNEELRNLTLDSFILELDEDSTDEQEQRIEEV